MKGDKGIICVIVVLVVIIAGLVGALIFLERDNVIYKTGNKLSQIINEGFEEADDVMKLYEEKPFSTEVTLGINLDLNDSILGDQEVKDLQDKINKTSINTNVYIDKKSDLIDVVLKAINDNKSLIEAEFAQKDNNIYVKISDVIDNYVKMEQENNEIDEVSNYEDIKIIYKTVEKEILKYLKDLEVSKEKVEKTYFDKKMNVTKNSLIVDTKMANEILILLIEALNNDDKALNSYVNLMKTSDDTVTKESEKKRLNELKDNYINTINNLTDETNEKIVMINVYTKGSAIKELEIIDVEQNLEIISVIANKDNYIIKFKSDNQNELNFKGTITKDEVNLTYTISNLEEDMSYTGKIELKQEIIEKNVNEKATFKISLDTGKDGVGKVALIVSSEVKVGEEKNIDLSNATEELPTDANSKLQVKLEEVLNEYGLTLEDIMGLILPMSFGDDYDYDADYDFDY